VAVVVYLAAPAVVSEEQAKLSQLFSAAPAGGAPRDVRGLAGRRLSGPPSRPGESMLHPHPYYHC
jgi:hypothetical protein